MEIHSNLEKSRKNQGRCIQRFRIGDKISISFEVEFLEKMNFLEHMVILITVLKCQKSSKNYQKIPSDQFDSSEEAYDVIFLLKNHLVSDLLELGHLAISLISLLKKYKNMGSQQQ